MDKNKMMNDIIELLKMGELQKLLLIIGGFIGSIFSFVVGGFDQPIQWLLILVCIDYATGVFCALKLGKWSSKVGYKGILKKVFMFLVVGVSVGLDTILKIETFRSIVIFAYALNEGGSIIENFDRMGYSSIIPKFMRNNIEQLKNKDNEK